MMKKDTRFVLLFLVLTTMFSCGYDETEISTDMDNIDSSKTYVIPVIVKSVITYLKKEDNMYKLFKFTEDEDQNVIFNDFTSILYSKSQLELTGVGFVYEFIKGTLPVSVDSVKSVDRITLENGVYTYHLSDKFISEIIHIKVGISYRGDTVFLKDLPLTIMSKDDAVSKDLQLLSDVYSISQPDRTITLSNVILLKDFKLNVSVTSGASYEVLDKMRNVISDNNVISDGFTIKVMGGTAGIIIYTVKIASMELINLSVKDNSGFIVDNSEKILSIPHGTTLESFKTNVIAPGGTSYIVKNVTDDEVSHITTKIEIGFTVIVSGEGKTTTFTIAVQNAPQSIFGNNYQVISEKIILNKRIGIKDFKDKSKYTFYSSSSVLLTDENYELQNGDIIQSGEKRFVVEIKEMTFLVISMSTVKDGNKHITFEAGKTSYTVQEFRANINLSVATCTFKIYNEDDKELVNDSDIVTSVCYIKQFSLDDKFWIRVDLNQ